MAICYGTTHANEVYNGRLGSDIAGCYTALLHISERVKSRLLQLLTEPYIAESEVAVMVAAYIISGEKIKNPYK